MRRRILSLFLFAGSSALPQAVDDAGRMEQSAIALVRSRDFSRLAKLLHDPQFLAGLPDGAAGKTRRLGHILTALKENTSPETEALCLGLAADSVFLADPDRMSFLLEVLAVVKPMTPAGAELFRRTADDGYFASNARLLAANGSPVALALFASMMLATGEPIEDRIECLRVALIPRRTVLPFLRTAEGILTGTKEPRLANGVIESVFDYHPEWFRPGSAPAAPQAWEVASPESLRAALRLAERAQHRTGLPPALRRAVARESAAIRHILSSQRP